MELYNKLNKLTPKVIRNSIKLILEACDPLFIFLYQKCYGYTKPIPPMRMRSLVGGRSIRGYIRGGANCAQALEQALYKTTGKNFDDNQKLLDFGCGCGRTLQHIFWSAPDTCQYFGCDVNSLFISWMQKHYHPARFFVNNFQPPLPFADQSFDLLYSVSIFTHLNETSQFLWLREIQRVLRPGGLALLTTQSQHALNIFLKGILSMTPAMIRQYGQRSLEKEGFIFLPYDDFMPDSAKYSGIQDAYGLTFHSHDYIYQRWSDSFEVLGIDTGTVDSLQDVVVLLKK